MVFITFLHMVNLSNAARYFFLIRYPSPTLKLNDRKGSVRGNEFILRFNHAILSLPEDSYAVVHRHCEKSISSTFFSCVHLPRKL